MTTTTSSTPILDTLWNERYDQLDALGIGWCDDCLDVLTCEPFTVCLVCQAAREDAWWLRWAERTLNQPVKYGSPFDVSRSSFPRFTEDDPDGTQTRGQWR